MTIAIFLDVDGPLNAWELPTGQRDRAGFVDHQSMLGFRMRMHPNAGRRLNELPDTRIVWATTWIETPEALEELAPWVGLPHGLDRIDRLERDWGTCGKLNGVRRYLHAHPEIRAFVWIDDDLQKDDIEFVRSCGAFGQAVRPYPNKGISAEEFDAIKEFVEFHANPLTPA